MDIGKKIRALRLGNNLTQEELANRLELTKGYISQLENNLTSPSMQTSISILDVLGTDVHEFFSIEEEQTVVYKKDDFYVKENDIFKAYD
jgi:transcriptional regulator with XRE-family HTH domain